MRHAAAALGLVLALLMGALLGGSMLDLPVPAVRLAPEVAQRLGDSGVAHPVTAVLLNFRGYDTLLEVAVLLTAVLALLALTGEADAQGAPSETAVDMLQAVARRLAPLMIVVAGYLLWAGSHRPGGAFQAAAVLAGAAVLLHVARAIPAWAAPRAPLRLGLTFGLAVFAGVAAALLHAGALLQYPPDHAGALILLVEAALTLSLGLMLAGLFLFAAAGEGPR